MASVDETLARLLLKDEVEQFLFAEAELLDERQYEEWLALLDDDIRYWMPMRRNVKFGELEREFTREGMDINWFDEGKDTLTRRVNQILTGVHWAEEPCPASATSCPTSSCSTPNPLWPIPPKSPSNAASSSTATASRPRPTFWWASVRNYCARPRMAGKSPPQDRPGPERPVGQEPDLLLLI